MKELHIMLVEDDPDDIELLQIAFQNMKIPCQMQVIMQGDAVLDQLKLADRLPDIIVLDLNLPRMHGREVLQLLKVSSQFQHIPVAILTTSSAKADRDFCQQSGAEIFLTKPSTVDGFREVTQAIVKAAVIDKIL